MRNGSAWLLFYGHVLHMDRREILATRYGELLDMIACYAISRGAKEKKKRQKMPFEEAVLLR